MSTADALMSAAGATAPDLDDMELYEIVDGQRVGMSPMSANSTGIGAELARVVGNFGIEHDLGRAYPEMLVKLPLDRDRNRRPDVIFVPYGRWPKGKALPPTNAWDVLPDLCVEVVSPTDRAEEVRVKVEEYFEAGVRLVWVVYPGPRLVDVFESANSVRVVRRDGVLDGGAVLPGFKLKLADLFPEPDPEPPAAPAA